MGWIGCVRFVKFCCDFMARTSALIAPVLHVLHRVLCRNEILPNAPKYYETHQNMSLGSNGVDRVRSLRKFRCDFVARTFALIAPVHTVLHRPSHGNEKSKCTQTLRNAPIHVFRIQWGGLGVFVAKNSDATSWHELVH